MLRFLGLIKNTRLYAIALVLLVLIGIVGYAKNTNQSNSTTDFIYLDASVDSISVSVLASTQPTLESRLQSSTANTESSAQFDDFNLDSHNANATKQSDKQSANKGNNGIESNNPINLQSFVGGDISALFQNRSKEVESQSKLKNALASIQTKAPSQDFISFAKSNKPKQGSIDYKQRTSNQENTESSPTNQNSLNFIESDTNDDVNQSTSNDFTTIDSSLDSQTTYDNTSSMQSSTTNKNLPTLQLPLDFNLNAWIPRLLQIIATTNTEALTTRSGICGTCMLHTYQIIAEFMQFHNAPPLSGGYFFDAIPNTNPFHSFQQRNALLFDTLNDIIDYYGRTNLTQHTEIFNNTVEVAFASSISMLPQYNWNLVGSASTTPEINALLSNIFNQARPGSMYLTVLMRYIPESHTIRGHAVVTIRAATGFIVIPTNIAGISLSGLRSYTQLATTPQELQSRYTMRLSGSQLGLVGLAFFEVSDNFNLPFASALSFRDCSGFGDDRRGNLALPRASMLNQCTSGRCIK